MKLKNFKIIEFQFGKKANLYSIIFEGEELSESDKFFEEYEQILPDNIDNLLLIIDNVVDKYGCDENYFKHERANQIKKIKDGDLRLYCIRLSNSVSIFGGGGIKDKRTTQEVAKLEERVQTLIEIERLINKRFKENEISISGNFLIGNLDFKKE